MKLVYNLALIFRRQVKLFLKFPLILSSARYQRDMRSAFGYLLSSQPLHFVDVGAAGSMPPHWKKAQCHLSYVGFEPDERSRDLIEDASSKLNSQIIRPEALGETTGHEIPFYLCRKPQVSSSYLPNREFLNRFPNPERYDPERYDVVGEISLTLST